VRHDLASPPKTAPLPGFKAGGLVLSDDDSGRVAERFKAPVLKFVRTHLVLFQLVPNSNENIEVLKLVRPLTAHAPLGW
jgi:hypothetical protein